jgi:hypothetical protein
MTIDPARYEQFMKLSVELTGFTDYVLQGTGCATTYYSNVVEIVGENNLADLLDVYEGVVIATPIGKKAPSEDKLPTAVQADLNKARKKARNKRNWRLRVRLLSNEKWGPIARNIIKLWYVSIWFELPSAWREAFGPLPNDRTFIPGAYSYTQGLLGPSVGAHVQGAKAPGYGTWADPPEIQI